MHFRHKINLMPQFPDFKVPGFDVEVYNRRFRESNVVIHAKAKEVSYPEHWGPVSVKCAFNGNEYYELGQCRYKVDGSSFLILNEGQTYSSYIHSQETVESFTINFSASFVKEVYAGHRSHDDAEAKPPIFCERLHDHDQLVSPYIFLLKELSNEFYKNLDRIEETYVFLLQSLFQLQQRESRQFQKIQAVKSSTRKELYQRLMRAKDHIDSCYADDVSLDKLAVATCLNPAYLLRQFKSCFGVTPRQYIISKRMTLAENLMISTDRSVTEICYATGYKDLTSFCKLFRHFYHSSPEAYRLQHQLKKSIFT
jgi:AraC family transcriptional regulator